MGCYGVVGFDLVDWVVAVVAIRCEVVSNWSAIGADGEH